MNLRENFRLRDLFLVFFVMIFISGCSLKVLSDSELLDDISQLEPFIYSSIDNIEVLSRQTDKENKTDKVVVEVESTNDSFYSKQEITLYYKYYEQGWSLENFSINYDSIILRPLFLPDEETIRYYIETISFGENALASKISPIFAHMNLVGIKEVKFLSDDVSEATVELNYNNNLFSTTVDAITEFEFSTDVPNWTFKSIKNFNVIGVDIVNKNWISIDGWTQREVGRINILSITNDYIIDLEIPYSDYFNDSLVRCTAHPVTNNTSTGLDIFTIIENETNVFKLTCNPNINATELRVHQLSDNDNVNEGMDLYGFFGGIEYYVPGN